MQKSVQLLYLRKIVVLLLATFVFIALSYFARGLAHATHYSGGLTKPTGFGPIVIAPASVSGNVTLHWNAVSGAEAYNIFVDNMNNRDATDCASPASGDKCYTTKSTSITISNISATTPYKVTIQAYKTNPTNANIPYLSPLAFTFLNVPAYRTIAGYVKDPSGNPVPGVKIAVQSGDVRYAYATTDASGKFAVSNHIKYNETYAVRVSAIPTGFIGPAKTSTVGWNWNFCTNPNWTGGKAGIDPSLYNHPWGDTPVGSGSYECQYAGSQIDCAGNENTSAFTAGRCSFTLAHAPTPTITKTPTNTPVPTVTPTKVPPSATPTQISCPIVPVDVAVMIDRSSSMWNTKTTDPSTGKTKSNLDWAKDAVTAFANAFSSTFPAQNGKVRISIGSFAKTASSGTFYDVNKAYSTVLSQIANINSGDTGSCLECGLYAANNKLREAGLNNNDASTKKVVIFLSDGRANATRSSSSVSHTVGGNAAIKEANRGRSKTYTYPIQYFVNGYGARVSESNGGILEWVLKGPPQDTTLGSLGIANGTGTPYYRYELEPYNWDNVFKSFQNSICTMSAFRASAGMPNQDVAGAETERITIDKATLKARIEAFVDALFREYHGAK